MSILTGRLKDRILIYKEVEQINNYSEREKSYQYDFPLRAEVSWVNGIETMTGQMSIANRTFKFKVRFHISRYNERQVIFWRENYYNIRSIDPDRNREYMIITADRIPTNSINIITEEEPL
jgi:SPP1 family predicted phage head-tail adaptor